MIRLACAGLLLLTAVPLVGQDTTATRDSLRAAPRPVARADSTAGPRNAPPDTVATTPISARLPIPRLEGPHGPLPAGQRWVFTRDSLVWSGAWTVADLLADIPGVFAPHAGFIQAATPLGVEGRGSDALEVFYDGVPWQPVGPDSTTPDLSAISLFTLRRVEVQQLPGLLRVFLVSERHEGRQSRSVVRIVSGALDAGGYAGLYQQRWDNGLGINLAADGLRSKQAADGSGVDRRFDAWARLDWTPSPSVAATWQVRRSTLERDPLTGGSLTVAGRNGTRTDALLTMQAGTRPMGQGWSVATSLRSSAFTDSAFGRQVMREALVSAGHAGVRDELRVRAGVGDGAVRRRLAADAGAVPLSWLVAHGGTEWTRDPFQRDTWRWWGTMGVSLGALGLSGEAVHTRGVSQPLVPADTVQRATDLGVHLNVATRLLGARVGLERHGAWAPAPLDPLSGLRLTPSPRTTWMVSSVRLGPVRSFTVSGWYADARGNTSPDFQPPTHSRLALTYRSKFWRTFHSGAFDLKIQWALETWGAGQLGVTTAGAPVTLPGHSFQEWFVQFEIAGFRAYWDLRNARNARAGYLPGLDQPRNAQTFGVKWEFSS